MISIHALREGSDSILLQATQGKGDFNPRSPRGERLVSSSLTAFRGLFQSTLSARGATALPAGRGQEREISIHALREGSDWWGTGRRCPAAYFNPRSPRGERRARNIDGPNGWEFQSTLSARGATSLPRKKAVHGFISIHALREGSDYRTFQGVEEAIISIHALREGSDGWFLCYKVYYQDFNPRSPRGERPQ